MSEGEQATGQNQSANENAQAAKNEGAAPQNVTAVVGPPPAAPPPPPPPPKEGEDSNGRHRWTHDPPMLAVTAIGVLVVVVATTLTQLSQCSTDRKVDALVANTDRLANFMRREARDTRKLRKATQRFAHAMDTQSTNTKDLVGQARQSAEAAAKSATAAQAQLNEIRLQDRAWVSESVTAIEPLSFGINGAQAGLTFVLRNVGHNPAINAQIASSMYLETSAFDPYRAQKELCARASKTVGAFGNVTLFGGETSPPEPITWVTGQAALDETSAKMGGLVIPIVVGCVDYQLVGEKVHRQSGFAYEFMLVRPEVKPTPCCVFSIKEGSPNPANVRAMYASDPRLHWRN